MEVNLKDIYNKFLQCRGVSIDTRTISKDDLFFGLKGPNFDGNKYASKALENGARFVVVDDPDVVDGEKYILVENSLLTLQELALHHRKQFKGHVFALTGSNGKTTTKELIVLALSSKYKVQGTQGNLNNHLGVPLTILGLNADTDIAVIEMGANKVGDIAELCAIALPTHGLITNIGIAHAEGFGGREGIIRGKSELFDFIRKNEGHVFINKEDEVLNNMAKRFNAPQFFPSVHSQFKAASPYVEYLDRQNEPHIAQLIGAYNFANIAAALAVALFFDVPENVAHQAVTQYNPSNNRSQVMELGTNKIILDAYNANPDSMRGALDNLKSFGEGKKLAFLGAMKELGELSEELHRDILERAMDTGIDMAMFVGEEFEAIRNAENPSCFYSNVEALISYLKKHPISDAIVLIKGSRSIEMEQLTQNKDIWH